MCWGEADGAGRFWEPGTEKLLFALTVCEQDGVRPGFACLPLLSSSQESFVCVLRKMSSGLGAPS